MEDKNKLVPFGKYKGQPVEVLQHDPQYTDWLSSQDWFRDKFQPIYNIIVNNFTEPTDTPEHNKLQANFINISSLYGYSLLSLIMKEKMDEQNIAIEDTQFEERGFDVIVEFSGERKNSSEFFEMHVCIEIKPVVSDDFPNVLRQIKQANTRYKRYIQKEAYNNYIPRILTVLFLTKYSGIGATREEFKELFRQERIHVIFEDNLLSEIHRIQTEVHPEWS